MKILVLAPQPFYIARGTPIDVDILVRALCEQGEEVHLLAYPDGADRAYPGLTIHRVPCPRWLRPRRPGFSAAKLVCDLFMFLQAWRLARRLEPDVVHAGEEAVFIAMFLRWTLGLGYVYDMDSSIAQQLVEQRSWLQPLAKLFNWCEARAIRSSVAVAPVCHALADLAADRGAEHIVTLHDISQLEPEDFVAGSSLADRLPPRAPRRPRVMYVGNLEPYQGVDLLLESAKVAEEHGASFDLVIAGGEGADIRGYQAMAERLGIGGWTHFIGPWPAERLGELLAEADVLVAPRIRGINTPMKVFPYLHSGRAVLVTDLPTHSQILDQSIAMMAPADPPAFGKALAQLALDEKLRERLGCAGRAFVQREHTYEAHQRRVGELYDLVSHHLAGPQPNSVKPPRDAAVLEKAV